MNVLSLARRDWPTLVRTVMVLIGYTLLHPHILPGLSDPVTSSTRALASAAALILVLSRLLPDEGSSLSYLGLSDPVLQLRLVGTMVVVGALFAILPAVAQAFFGGVSATPIRLQNVWLTFLVIPASAATALIQEVLFRGYLLMVLSRSVGGASAALIASGMYSFACALHPHYGAAMGGSLFLWGAMLTLSAHYHGSMWAPLGLNFGRIVVGALVSPEPAASTAVFVFGTVEPIVRPSLFLPEGGVLQGALAVVGIWTYWLLLARRGRRQRKTAGAQVE